MAVTYGFYNSVNSDRKYNSVQMSELFDGLIEDGVYLSIGDAFATTQNTVPDLHVQVGEGKAWFKHTWTKNDAHILLTLETPDILYPRIDSVVLEVDRSDAVRANTIKIIKGTAAQSPVEPTMQHTGTLDQYRLANIAVAANDTEIINANITYKVGTVETPFVAGVLSSFDVETLLASWQSYFDNTWLPAREAEGEAEIDAWLLVQETDLDSTFDAWLATLTDPLLFHQRQGGSGTNWSEAGSNTYSPAANKVIAGAIEGLIEAGYHAKQYTITFPSAFAVGSVPLVFVTIQEYSPEGYDHLVMLAPMCSDNTTFTLTATREGTTGNVYFYANWLAIGAP